MSNVLELAELENGDSFRYVDKDKKPYGNIFKIISNSCFCDEVIVEEFYTIGSLQKMAYIGSLVIKINS